MSTEIIGGSCAHGTAYETRAVVETHFLIPERRQRSSSPRIATGVCRGCDIEAGCTITSFPISDESPSTVPSAGQAISELFAYDITSQGRHRHEGHLALMVSSRVVAVIITPSVARSTS